MIQKKLTSLFLGVVFVGTFVNSAYASGGLVEVPVREVTSIEPSIIHYDNEEISKRLNALRTDPSEAGVWARGVMGDTKIRDYKYDFSIVSSGYDKHIENEARHLFTGLSLSYSTNDCDDKLIGKTKSLGLNLYGSWLGKENNDYVDLIIRYGKLDKEYFTKDYGTGGTYLKSQDYDKKLWSFSAKYGRRFTQNNEWYYEPFCGLSYGHISKENYLADYDTPVKADSIVSTIAKAGVQFGKNIKGIEYYGKVEVNHEFDGMITVREYGQRVEDDMGGTWYKVGIGAARKIDKNNSFYIDIEKDFGNKVKKPYSIGFGYRYTW